MPDKTLLVFDLHASVRPSNYCFCFEPVQTLITRQEVQRMYRMRSTWLAGAELESADPLILAKAWAYMEPFSRRLNAGWMHARLKCCKGVFAHCLYRQRGARGLTLRPVTFLFASHSRSCVLLTQRSAEPPCPPQPSGTFDPLSRIHYRSIPPRQPSPPDQPAPSA